MAQLRISMLLAVAVAVAAELARPEAVLAADMSSVKWLPKPTTSGWGWTTKELARLRRDIDAILARKTLRGAHIGLVAIDTKTGTVLYARNADQEFMPASNFKLLVGVAALHRLGPDFSFTTTVLADGPVRDGTLQGNVYLHGGGDALLTAKDLDGAAAALVAQGIKKVAGALVTDAGYFDSQRLAFGWSWDDLPFYYAPVVSALCLEDNVVHIYMSPGAQVGAPVKLRIEPQSSAFVIDNQLVTGPAKSKDTSDLSHPWNEPRTLKLSGSYPLDAKESGDLRAAVPDPESYAGDVFLRALGRAGIVVAGGMRSGTAPPQTTMLYSHASEKLPALLADFWYPSDNLMGELFLKTLGVLKSGAPGTDEHGAAVERDYLKSIHVDPTTVTIADGSGLSQYDRITPRDLLAILQSEWNGPYRDIVLDALPVAGVRGTSKSAYLGTPAEKHVFAKTGSISHVRSISGYLRTRRHGAVTFSFMTDDWMEELGDLAKLRADLFSRIITD